jgi:threonine/homoserine/homoserine lactone efflux protein
MTRERYTELARKGRMVAIVIAGTGLFWILASVLGGQFGLTQRTRALFDLMALAGFVWALWMIYQIWRLRQDDKG